MSSSPVSTGFVLCGWERPGPREIGCRRVSGLRIGGLRFPICACRVRGADRRGCRHARRRRRRGSGRDAARVRTAVARGPDCSSPRSSERRASSLAVAGIGVGDGEDQSKERIGGVTVADWDAARSPIPSLLGDGLFRWKCGAGRAPARDATDESADTRRAGGWRRRRPRAPAPRIHGTARTATGSVPAVVSSGTTAEAWTPDWALSAASRLRDEH